MRNHVVVVRDREIWIPDCEVVAGSVGDTIDLRLDSEWDGLDITVFVGSGEEADACDWDGEPIEFPEDALSSTGWLPVSVVGMAPDGGVRTATKACQPLLGRSFAVVESGETGGGGTVGILV